QGPDRRCVRCRGRRGAARRGEAGSALRGDEREAARPRDQGAREEDADAHQEPRIRGGGQGARRALGAEEARLRRRAGVRIVRLALLLLLTAAPAFATETIVIR